MQFRLIVALALVATAASMTVDKKLTTTDTTLKGKAVSADPNAAKKMKSADGKGQTQNEAGDKLVADASKTTITEGGIMGAVKAKAGKMKEQWASRKVEIKSILAKQTTKTVNVLVSKNVVGEKAAALETATVFKSKFVDPVDYDKMSLSMKRKIEDLTILTNQLSAFSGKFFPKIVEMNAKVKVQKAHIAANAKKAGSETTQSNGAPVAEQVVDEELLSEDMKQLQVLKQMHNDLMASVKKGDDSLALLAPKTNAVVKTTSAKYAETEEKCVFTAEDWGALMGAKAASVEKAVNSCTKPPVIAKRRSGGLTGTSEVHAIASGVAELKSTRTEMVKKETLLTFTLPKPAFQAVIGGDARFKQGKDALFAKIDADEARISADQVEVARLDNIATMPMLRGGAQTAFLEDGTGSAKKITTKAKVGFAGGFDEKEKIAAGTSVAGSNKVADRMLSKGPELGSMTKVSSSSTSTKSEQVADFSKISGTSRQIIDALDKATPRAQESKDEITNAAMVIGSTTAETLWSQGDAYVKGLLAKQGAAPSPADLLKIATKYAKSADVDKTVAVVDKRLVWLKDAMKEMSKYYIWAEAELKRGVTVQTITDKAAYKVVIEKITHDSQETAVDSQQVMKSMMEAFVKVQASIGSTVAIIKEARNVITQTDTMIANFKRVTAANAKVCHAFKLSSVGLLKDTETCMEKDTIKMSVDGMLKLCESNPHKTNACADPFVTWFNGKDGKEAILSSFRETLSLYMAILGAFKEASGQ